jgi:hypothetical protein
VCDLGDADVGVGQHRLGSLDVVVGKFWRAMSISEDAFSNYQKTSSVAQATF